MKKHTGGCHCGAVRFEVTTDLAQILECNCSHCFKKGFLLTFVDTDQFTITKGADHLTEYQFNKKAIRHLFCTTCGTQAFALGITFPKACINVRCIDDIDLTSLTPTHYNGKDL